MTFFAVTICALDFYSLSTVLTVLIGVIMVLSLLSGLIHGFKKSMYWLCATIIFWIVFFVTSRWVTGASLWKNESLYGLLGLDSSYSNLMEYAKAMIANAASVDPATLTDPAIDNTLIAIVHSVIKIVYLLVLWLVMKLFALIIYRCCFKKIFSLSKRPLKKLEKKQRKYIKKHDKESAKLAKKIAVVQKHRKHNKLYRPLGLLSGAARGLVCSFIIMSLINSLIGVLPDLSHSDEVAATDGEDYNKSIYDYIVEQMPEMKDVVDYIAEYQQSNLSTITSLKIGGKPADSIFIDAIVSGKSEDYSFALRKEIEQVMKIAVHAFSLTNGFDMESVTWTALNDSQVNDAQQILYILADDELVKNLGSVAVSLVLTMDSIKTYLPDDLKDSEYKDVNWSNELANIAGLVATVYSLGDDLTKLDVNDLDPDIVETLVQQIAGLESIQLVGHIGSHYAVDSFLTETDQDGNVSNAEQIASMKESLAAVTWSQDINDISVLYREYIGMNLQQHIEDNTDSESGTVNMLGALTSVPTDSYTSVVDTIFETSFLTAILPDVLQIVKDKYVPKEYADMINPNVTLTSQWKDEINTVLTIVSNATENGASPIKNIETFDFKTLNKISTNTIVNSNLLSYAMIKLMVDGSTGSGLLGEALQDYICVPDDLRSYDSETHTFDPSWYGENGELYIMLDSVKNAASHLENLNYPVESIPPMLTSIDADKLGSSKVLNYTVSKLLVSNSGEMLAVPQAALDERAITVNGNQFDLIKESEIKNLLKAISTPGVIDLEKLYAYYTFDEQGNRVLTPVEQIEEGQEYVVVLDIQDIDKILGLLKSEKLYDPEKDDSTNLNLLFSSSILRTTITMYLNNQAGQYIIIPSTSSASSVEQYIVNSTDPETGVVTKTMENINVLTVKECSNLLKTINKLDINMSSIEKDPLSILDGFKIVNADGSISYNSTLAESIFDESKSGYSEVLHATLTKYINDYANPSEVNSDDFKIVVPDECYDSQKYIASKEVLSLVKAVTYVDLDAFINPQEGTDIYSLILDNENIGEAFDSDILRASISEFLTTQESSVIIPDEASSTMHHTQNGVTSEKKVITSSELNTLLDGIRELKEQTQLEVSELLKFDNIKVSDINAVTPTLVDSYVLRATISKEILALKEGESFTIIVPDSALSSSDMIKESEIIAIMDGISSLCKPTTTINTISTDLETLAINSLNNSADKLLSSDILHATVSNEIAKNENADIIIPESVYENSIISKNEIKNLLGNLSLLVSEQASIDNIANEIENLKVGNLQVMLASTDYDLSTILNASITKKIQDINDPSSSFNITIPTKAYLDGTDNKQLKKSELVNLVDALLCISEPETLVSKIDSSLDGLSIEKLNNRFNDLDKSLIIHATISEKMIELGNDGTITIPTTDTTIYDEDNYISHNELSLMVNGIYTLLPTSDIDSIETDFESLKISSINSSIDALLASTIMHTTISSRVVKEQNDTIIIPTSAYEGDYLSKDELKKLMNGLAGVTSQDATLNTISSEMESLKVGKLKTMLTANEGELSVILNASITKKIKEAGDSSTSSFKITIPDKAYIDNTNSEQIKKSELVNLVDALLCISDETTLVSNIDSSLDGLEIAKLNNRFDEMDRSIIIHASISDKMIAFSNDGTITVPTDSSIYDEDNYISHAELASMLNGLHTLLPNSNINNIENEFDELKISSINGAIDELLASNIMHATISTRVVDEQSATIIIPTSAYDGAYLSKDELKELMSGLNGITSQDATLKSISSEIDKLKVSTLDTTLSSDGFTLSEILKASISKQIIDLQTNSSSTDAFKIVIHSSVYEIQEVTISQDEITKLIHGLASVVDADTFVSDVSSSLDGLTVYELKVNFTTLDSSLIMHGTISQKITELGNESGDVKIVIPDSLTYDDNGYIPQSELSNLVNGIYEISDDDQTPVSDITNTLSSLTVNKLNEKIAVIDNSLIMQATISSKIIDISSEQSSFSIIVPESVKQETDLIYNSELENMMEGINTMLGSSAATTKITDISGSMENLTLADLTQSKMEVVLDSNILHSTISNKLIDMKEDGGSFTIKLPTDAYVANDQTLILKTELSPLMDKIALLVPQSTSINGISEAFADLTVKQLNDNISSLVESKIMRATVSSKIYDIESDGGEFAIKIPTTAKESSEYIYANELSNLMNGINTMLAASSATTKVNDVALQMQQITIANLNSDAMTIIVRSEILHNSISQKIIDLGADSNATLKITIPLEAYVEASAETLIKDSELISLMNSLSEITSPETKINQINQELDSLKVSTLDSKSNELLMSNIMHATITNQIVKSTQTNESSGDATVLYVDNKDLEDDDYDLFTDESMTYILKDELQLFIHSLSLIHSDTFATLTSFSSSTIFTIEDVDGLFASKIMVLTMSPKVYDMFNNNSTGLVFPDANNQNINEKYEYSRYSIDDKELKALYRSIKALNVVGEGEDIGQISLDYDKFMNNLTNDNIATLVVSNIMSYNIYTYMEDQNSKDVADGGFGNVLALSGKEKYYEDDTNTGDLLPFLQDLKALKDNTSYYNLLVNDDYSDNVSDTMSICKEPEFIRILTNDNILLDSIPSFIGRFKTMMSQELITLLGNNIYVPSKEIDGENDSSKWQQYWRGTQSPYSDGQLYKFFDAIDKGNELPGHYSSRNETGLKASLDAMIASDITRPMAVDFITNSTTVAALNTSHMSYLANGHDLVIPANATDSTYDWNSQEGQTYLEEFVKATCYSIA